MKRIILIGFILGFANFSFAQTDLWSENFTSKAIGSTSGSTSSGTPGGTWSVTTTPSGTFSVDNIPFISRGFMIDDTLIEGVWKSNTFSIANTGMATISVNLYTVGTLATDYVRVYYSVDGGAEVMFAEMLGQLADGSATGSAVVSGNTLQIIVRGRDTNPASFIVPFAFYFDDISVTSVPVLYSCATANWNVASTWSTVGFTGPCNAAAPPTVSQVAIIGGGFRVDLPANANVGGVDVRTTGTLRYTAATIGLGIDLGLVRVRAGGIINSNGQTDARINFRQNVSGGGVQVDLGGALTIDDISFITNANTLHYFTGAGTLTVVDDVIFSVNGTNLISNMISPLNVGDQINIAANATITSNQTTTVGGVTFGGAGTFNNNQNLTVTNNISYSAAGTFNNNAPATASGVAFGGAGTFNNNQSLAVTNSISYTAAGTFNNSATATATQILFNTNNANFNNNSSYSGNITVNDNGDNGNTFTNASGATAAIGTINANDGNLVIANAGTINQTGNFTNVDTGSNGDFTNTGTWNWSLTPNTTFDTDMATIFDLSATGNTFNYNGNGAQRIIPVTSGYGNLLLSTAGAKSANNASWSVKGNWTVSGTASFVPGSGTITLNGGGSTVQTISNAAGETFNGLTINNTSSAPIVFNNNVTASSALTMTSGIVNLSGNTFTLGTNGVASTLTRSASTITNWMYGGDFRRFWLAATAVSSTGANSYGLFPVGASVASSYRPVTINSTVNPTGAGAITVTHNSIAGSTDLSPVFNDGGTNLVRKLNAQSIVTNSGVTGGTYTLTSTMTGLLAGTANQIRLAASNAPLTVTTYARTNVANTGTAPNPTVGRSGLAIGELASDWRIVSVNSTSTPLPIQLINFTASQVDNEVQLSWATASELNNDFFEIQRLAPSDEKFVALEKIHGSGTTNKRIDYSTVDRHPALGKNYYRLMQIDFDGTSTYSDVKLVDFNGVASLNVYPNPVHNENINVELGSLKPKQKMGIQLMNSIGLVTYSLITETDQHGLLRASIPPPTSQGIYIVVVKGETEWRSKVVIE